MSRSKFLNLGLIGLLLSSLVLYVWQTNVRQKSITESPQGSQELDVETSENQYESTSEPSTLGSDVDRQSELSSLNTKIQDDVEKIKRLNSDYQSDLDDGNARERLSNSLKNNNDLKAAMLKKHSDYYESPSDRLPPQTGEAENSKSLGGSN